MPQSVGVILPCMQQKLHAKCRQIVKVPRYRVWEDVAGGCPVAFSGLNFITDYDQTLLSAATFSGSPFSLEGAHPICIIACHPLGWAASPNPRPGLRYMQIPWGFYGRWKLCDCPGAELQCVSCSWYAHPCETFNLSTQFVKRKMNFPFWLKTGGGRRLHSPSGLVLM